METLKHFVLNEHTNDLYKKEAISSISLTRDIATKINELVDAYNNLNKWQLEKHQEQDGTIRKAIIYIKDNLINTLSELVTILENEKFFDKTIATYTKNLENQLNNLLGSLKTGSTTGDAELIDARYGADGWLYESLGDAIRTQIKNILDDMYEYLDIEFNYTMGDVAKFQTGNTVVIGEDKFNYLVEIPVITGEKYLLNRWVCANMRGVVQAYKTGDTINYISGLLDTETAFIENDEVVIKEGVNTLYINVFVTDTTNSSANRPFTDFSIKKYMFKNDKIMEQLENVNVNEITSNYDVAGNYPAGLSVGVGNYSTDCSLINGVVKSKDLTGQIVAVRQCADNFGSCAYVDFESNSIGFAVQKSAYYNYDTITKETEITIPFTLVANREYLIVDRMEIMKHTFTIQDSLTGEEYTVTKTETNYHNRNGYHNIASLGNTEVVKEDVLFLQPHKPKVLIAGDSFVNGFYPYRYATLLKRTLKGNAFLDAVSGCTSGDLLNRFNNYLYKVKPEFVIIGIGTNDTDFNEWKTNVEKIITKVIEMGATPVLTTITFRTDTTKDGFINSVNSWIKSSGYRYIDFNVVTSLNYEGKTINSYLFNEDGLHPNEEGFKRMFNRIKVDVPELFV